MALRRVLKQAGFASRADFVAWAKPAGWKILNEKVLDELFSPANLSRREMLWHTVEQLVIYSCQHSAHLDPAREVPRMAGFWQAAYGRIPDLYTGRVIAPAETDIAHLCQLDDPADLHAARRDAAELSRLIELLRAEIGLLTEQISDRDEQVLRLRRELEQAASDSAAWRGTATARQEALLQLREQLTEANRAREADDQRLSEAHGRLQSARQRAADAAAIAAFSQELDDTDQAGVDALRADAPHQPPAGARMATPELRALAEYLREQIRAHPATLDEIARSTHVSPEVIEPLLYAALLPDRRIVLAVAAECGADIDRVSDLYAQAQAAQPRENPAEKPSGNPVETPVSPGQNPDGGDGVARGSVATSPQAGRRRLIHAARIGAAVAVLAAASAIMIHIGGRAADNDAHISSTPSASSSPTLLSPAVTIDAAGIGIPAVSRDGLRVAALFEGEIRIWDATTKKVLRTIAHQREAALYTPVSDPDVVLNADGTRVAVAHARTSGSLVSLRPPELGVWDVATGEKINVPFDSPGSELIFADRGTVLFSTEAGRSDWGVSRYDVDNPGSARPVIDTDGPVVRLALSQDNKTLAVATDKKISFYTVNGSGYTPVGTPLTADMTGFARMAFSPDASELTVLFDDGRMTRRNRDTGTDLPIPGPPQMAKDIGYSANGGLLIPTNDYLQADTTSTGNTLFALHSPSYRGLSRYAFSHDGSHLVAFSDDALLLWHLKDQPALK